MYGMPGRSNQQGMAPVSAPSASARYTTSLQQQQQQAVQQAQQQAQQQSSMSINRGATPLGNTPRNQAMNFMPMSQGGPRAGMGQGGLVSQIGGISMSQQPPSQQQQPQQTSGQLRPTGQPPGNVGPPAGAGLGGNAGMQAMRMNIGPMGMPISSSASANAGYSLPTDVSSMMSKVTQQNMNKLPDGKNSMMWSMPYGQAPSAGQGGIPSGLSNGLGLNGQYPNTGGSITSSSQSQQASNQQSVSGTENDMSGRFSGFSGQGGLDISHAKNEFSLNQEDYGNLSSFKRPDLTVDVNNQQFQGIAAPAAFGTGRLEPSMIDQDDTGYPLPLNPGSKATPQIPTGTKLSGIPDRFGILGLTGVLGMADQDLSMISIPGCDLASVGLNLINSQDMLYPSFVSAFNKISQEPEFALPLCYQVQPLPDPRTKMAQFNEETLFYIFYTFTRDAIQDSAAQELYNRGWRFHKEWRLWITRDRTSELVAKGETYERGSYIIWDAKTWEKSRKECTLMYEMLEDRRAAAVAAVAAAAAAAGGATPNGTTGPAGMVMASMPASLGGAVGGSLVGASVDAGSIMQNSGLGSSTANGMGVGILGGGVASLGSMSRR